MIRVNSCPFVVELFAVVLLASSSLAAPKIHCENRIWEFGERLNGGELVHEYLIENRGNEPLEFGTLKNCCGMTVDFPCKSLAPGSNAVCKATFDISRRSGKQNKAIYIASNDPKRPYFILKMQGMLRQALEVEPRYIRFSPTGGKTSETVRMTSSEAPFSINDLKCTAEGVQVTKKKISDLEWALDVQLAPDSLGGKIQGKIEVLTDHPQHPKIKISLYGEVPSAVKVSPSKVLVKEGSEFVSRYVAVRSQELFQILSADLKNCDGTIEQKKLGTTGWSLALSLNPASIQSEAHLAVTTDHPLMPTLTVPVHVIH